ncbi:hypothetical protein GIB67_042192 [Kingdonia uniflora]|uniref:Uncharacterized protein n=1 Tax=Kingdonia uniflora TaxID=39325 RepID=A0A7J7LDZ8_9MAGN|nr:hypothetical protein GIB67_042192 [Kingdonia uniflora]
MKFDYDLGGESDLFKAPELFIEEPVIGFDPMTATISLISCGENGISTQTFKAEDIESIQNEQLLSEVFYECKKDLLAKSAIEEPLTDVLGVDITALCLEEAVADKDVSSLECPIQTSVSSQCLNSVERIHGEETRPNFLDFHVLVNEGAHGIQRAFSEGDIQLRFLNYFKSALFICLEYVDSISSVSSCIPGCGGGSLILSFPDRLLAMAMAMAMAMAISEAISDALNQNL